MQESTSGARIITTSCNRLSEEVATPAGAHNRSVTYEYDASAR